MDGGKTPKAVVKKQRTLVIQDLNLLAVVRSSTGRRTVWLASKGIRPILKQLRILAEFLFSCGGRLRQEAKKSNLAEN